MKLTSVLMTAAVLSFILFPTAILAADLPSNPGEFVEAFHKTVASGDRDSALAFLDTELSVFESGSAELSLKEYVSHHLDADIEFNSSTKRKVIDQRVWSSGDAAWVLTETEIKGKFRNRKIDISGVETVNLVRRQDGWRIIHIHWSHRVNGQ